MALHVHHSPLYFFDAFIANHYRQMAADMNRMREQMYQLIPHDMIESELESTVPIVEEDGERKMRMEFNVKNYKPHEVRVKLLADNILQVCVLVESISTDTSGRGGTPRGTVEY
jgi:polyhydroxyalkanoate synthesis regulator protein